MTNSTFSIVITLLFLIVRCPAVHGQLDTLLIPSFSTPVDTLNENSTPSKEGIPQNILEKKTKIHSPKKAAIMSAILPGLGQAYNNRYWKIPIIYGGFALSGYYLSDNLKNIEKYKNAYIADIDGDPNTINDSGYNTDDLNTLIDQYTQWRDLSYIAIGIIYVLNILDASVDAHLLDFNVSEDISMNISPTWMPLNNRVPGLTLTVKL